MAEPADCLVIVKSSDPELLERSFTFPASTRLAVGCAPDNALVLRGPGTSRKHARFEWRHDGCWVIDLGSSGGTYVNNERVEATLLQVGDVVQVGDTIFRARTTSRPMIIETVYARGPIDGLTHVLTKRALLELMDAVFLAHARPHSVIVFDLDRLAAINHAHGHHVGDQLLRAVAALLERYAYQDDLLGRSAGDEFVLVVPGADLAATTARARALQAALAAGLSRLEGVAVPATVSVGVALVAAGMSSAELVEAGFHHLRLTRALDREANRAGQVVEAAAGLCASRGSRTLDVGAGHGDGVLVVADGCGGHDTGWLGARFAIRVILEQLTSNHPQFVGAATAIPEEWGWSGAAQTRDAGQLVYDACVSALGDRTALPRDLRGLFQHLDRVLAEVPPRYRITRPVVQCTAATVDARGLHFAHAGVGRALLLRAGSEQWEDLLTPHYMHRVHERMKLGGTVPVEQLPREIIVNGLGALDTTPIGIDERTIVLAAGDLLVMCSKGLDVPDDQLVGLVRQGLRDDVPLASIARAIEARAARGFGEADRSRARDVAFLLVRRSPAR